MRDCDFIPAEYRERHRVQRMMRHRAGALLLMFAAMGFWFGTNQYRIASTEAMVSEIHGQKSQIESVAARKLEMEQARTVLENLRNLLDELSGRRSLMPVFGDLSRRMPESIVLTSCQLYEPIFSDYSVIDLDSGMDPDSPAALANTLASAARDTAQDVVPEHRGLKLVGVASTIPDIINLAAELDRSPLFFQVDMEIKEPTVYLGQPARRFEVRCRLMPQREAGA